MLFFGIAYLRYNKLNALVWRLWEQTNVLMVVCLNPSTVYLMDIFSHIPICCKNCNDKDENEQKEAGESPFKKYFSSTSVGSLYKDILSIYKCEPESVESVRR